MASIRSLGDTSFNKKLTAPAWMAGMTLSSSTKLVSAITRVSLIQALIWRVAEMPSNSGITRSISTTSGLRRAVRSTAILPFTASPTTTMYRLAVRAACAAPAGRWGDHPRSVRIFSRSLQGISHFQACSTSCARASSTLASACLCPVLSRSSAFRPVPGCARRC
jgi:hypothetical protein